MSVAYRLPGTLETQDAETALLWEAGCQGLMQDGDSVVAYFETPVELPLPGRWEDVPDADWLADYYAGLKPVVFERLVVAPTHCELPPEPARKVLWLDPGMAFGTGHHETTGLALRALGRLRLEGKTVLDVGAGSGILAIAAGLLGARAVTGLDTDPATLIVAEQNRELNRAGLGATPLEFRLGSVGESSAPASADVVVANLYAELHAQLAPGYARVLRSGGRLLASGILETRLPLVMDALIEHFEELRTERDGEWVLVEGKRP